MARGAAPSSQAEALEGRPRGENAELEIVPGVTGVQTALDLRSPDRKSERARGQATAGSTGATEPHRTERAGDSGVAAPLAVIRAAHVEYSAPERV